MRRALLPLVLCLAVLGSSCATVVSEGHLRGELPYPDSTNYYLSRSILNIRVYDDKAETGRTRQITITRTVEADPAAALRFKVVESPLSQDVLDVKTTPDGLITSVTSEATDMTPDIIKNIANIVFASASGGANFAGRSLPAGDTALTASRFAASYDPFDPVEAQTVRARLQKEGFCILIADEVHDAPQNACAGRASPSLQAVVPVAYAKVVPGIYYRRTKPTPIRVFQQAGSGWRLIWAGSESMFDYETLYQLTFDRGACIKKKIEAIFKDGALSQLKVDKPSELAGCTGALVEVAKIVAAIPLAGFKQDQAILQAQADKLKAEAAYISAQRQVLDLYTQQAAEPGRLLISPDYAARVLASPSRALVGGEATRAEIDRSSDLLVAICIREKGLRPEECATQVARDSSR